MTQKFRDESDKLQIETINLYSSRLMALTHAEKPPLEDLMSAMLSLSVMIAGSAIITVARNTRMKPEDIVLEIAEDIRKKIIDAACTDWKPDELKAVRLHNGNSAIRSDKKDK